MHLKRLSFHIRLGMAVAFYNQHLLLPNRHSIVHYLLNIASLVSNSKNVPNVALASDAPINPPHRKQCPFPSPSVVA